MKVARFCFLLIASMIGMFACQQPVAKTIVTDKSLQADSNAVRIQLITNAIPMPIQLSTPSDSTGRMFVADHKGRIWIIKNDSLLSKPFLDFTTQPVDSIKTNNLGTINAMAFHPQFASNHKFYVCYNAVTTIAGNRTKLEIDEFTQDKNNPDAADMKSRRRILELEGKRIFNNGAAMVFGPDGYFYISIGDDPFGDTTYTYRAQDLNYLTGKLLRIDVNKTPYSIPKDNPFVGIKNARPEIWAYGFRKMWRFSFDPKSQQIFGADVGENRKEEINIVTKGGNYGWPIMEGDTVFRPALANGKEVLTAPVNIYGHKVGLCVIGGEFYYGKEIPFLQNKFVYGDFKEKIFTLTKSEKGEWIRDTVRIKNKPVEPFLICAFNKDKNNEMYVMGILNSKKGPKGAVYKIVK